VHAPETGRGGLRTTAAGCKDATEQARAQRSRQEGVIFDDMTLYISMYVDPSTVHIHIFVSS
jgi:hypothetical protein